MQTKFDAYTIKLNNKKGGIAYGRNPIIQHG